ncbi:hypothetical protein K2173_025626 [Erythroxylum novogranatense]|uniref:Uncharacterized protein n=1 Tax=Erythroxylum novogranatense TaxID=1862640 RepID=A0AAV8SNM0_9ROSI|nr:hypothetical protein K2173_025626 [Erythroxylum novogranatense]
MHTLASTSTMQKPLSEEFDYSAGPTLDVAKRVGEPIAKCCLETGISKVAFDRGGYPNHGRVKAIAEVARENGLEFLHPCLATSEHSLLFVTTFMIEGTNLTLMAICNCVEHAIWEVYSESYYTFDVVVILNFSWR